MSQISSADNILIANWLDSLNIGGGTQKNKIKSQQTHAAHLLFGSRNLSQRWK